jgi:hypothetical protein
VNSRECSVITSNQLGCDLIVLTSGWPWPFERWDLSGRNIMSEATSSGLQEHSCHSEVSLFCMNSSNGQACSFVVCYHSHAWWRLARVKGRICLRTTADSFSGKCSSVCHFTSQVVTYVYVTSTATPRQRRISSIHASPFVFSFSNLRLYYLYHGF